MTHPTSIRDVAIDGFVSGIISGALTRGITQPLDVLKVRMQLQVEQIANISGSKYTSLVQTFTKIYHEEGIKALWKGHVPAQLISVMYGAIQFPIYEALKHTGHFNDFFAGGMGGVSAIVFCYPIDMMRTRLIGQGADNVVYTGLRDGVKKVYIRDGFRGFFRGLTPACILIFPQTAIRFHVYKWLKRSMSVNKADEPSINVVAGFFSGIVSKASVYPMDLAKRRMQIQGFEEARASFGRLHTCRGFFNCIFTVIREEGFAAMYKGLTASVVKSGCVATLAFAFYETGLRIMRSS